MPKLKRKQIKELFIYASNDTRNWTPNKDSELEYKFSDNKFTYDGVVLYFKQIDEDSRMVYPKVPFPILPYNYHSFQGQEFTFIIVFAIYTILTYFIIAAPMLYGLLAISNSIVTDIPVGNGKVLLYTFMFHPILLAITSLIFRLHTLKYVERMKILDKLIKEDKKKKKQEKHEKENKYFYELVDSHFKKQVRKEKLNEIENS